MFRLLFRDDASGGSAVTLANTAVVADFYVRGREAPLTRIEIGAGLSIEDEAGGKAVLVISSTFTVGVEAEDPSRPSSSLFAPRFLTRAVIGLTDLTTGTHRTVGAVFICPFLPNSVGKWPLDSGNDVVIVAPPQPAVPDAPSFGLDLSNPQSLMMF